MTHTPSRRQALAQLSVAAAAPLLAASPFRHVYAQTTRPIRVGYLHIPTCDAQMWLMKELDTWTKEGLDPTFTRFNTGIEGFSALVGGSVDVFTTGGVTHNFPARGQGVVVLPNVIEYGGQIFGRSDAGINSLQDLKGKKIATTLGTTGQIFLHTALKSVGLDSTKDVELISQTMPAAVTSYVTGSLPALSTWVPFNLRARDAKTSKLLADSRTFASKGSGFVVAAYSANRRVLDSNPDLVRRLVAAWGPANEMLRTKKEESAQILHAKYYKGEMEFADMQANFAAMDIFSTTEWARKIKDGSLYNMLDSVTKMFVEFGAMKDPLPASKYADFSHFSSIYKA
jgi:NitT/TauT family transport system substrate-binding protein